MIEFPLRASSDLKNGIRASQRSSTLDILRVRFTCFLRLIVEFPPTSKQWNSSKWKKRHIRHFTCTIYVHHYQCSRSQQHCYSHHFLRPFMNISLVCRQVDISNYRQAVRSVTQWCRSLGFLLLLFSTIQQHINYPPSPPEKKKKFDCLPLKKQHKEQTRTTTNKNTILYSK